MDRLFYSFNELADAPAFGNAGEYAASAYVANTEQLDNGWELTLNMAQFNKVAKFNGCPFYACSSEEQHGGMLESPHIHININTGRGSPKQKFWISSFLDNTSRSQLKQGSTIEREYQVSFAQGSVPPEIQRDIIKHLNKHKDAVMKEWNDYVRFTTSNRKFMIFYGYLLGI